MLLEFAEWLDDSGQLVDGDETLEELVNGFMSGSNSPQWSALLDATEHSQTNDEELIPGHGKSEQRPANSDLLNPDEVLVGDARFETYVNGEPAPPAVNPSKRIAGIH